jgi:hypothetical protein
MNERLLKIAHEFGAEAYANGRTMCNADDRADMAHYYGVSRWSEIPEDERNQLIDAFFQGVATEKKAKSLTTTNTTTAARRSQ